ncbi:MAG: hypothetical protein ACETWK_02880 [Candidatus Aminicenantaceae bacterium]
MKAKEVLLLILIVATGITFYHVHTGKINIGWDLGEFILWEYEEFTFEESHEVDPPFPSRLKIINSHGEIEIQGTDDEKIYINFQKKIRRKKEENAREIADKLKMHLEQGIHQTVITTNRNEFRRKNFDTDFTISLPEGMDIEIENSYGLVKALKVGNTKIKNSHGKIIASEIRGELNIQNSYRDVEIESVQSNLELESKYSTVWAKNIKGEAKIIQKHGTVNLENVQKNVEILSPSTEIFGHKLMGAVNVDSSHEKITLFDVGPTQIKGNKSDVEVDGAMGSVKINNAYGKLKLNNIKGNIDIEGKSVKIYGRTITGEIISISSSYEDIELVEFSGKTTISLNNGNMILDPISITHPITAQGDYAAIKFFWPQGGKYPIEVRAKNGEIKWKLSEDVSLQEENHTSILKAFIQEKEKPSIFLSTTYRDIWIEE